jgi:hypothetical protein
MKYLPLALLLLLLSCEAEKEGKMASFPTVFEESGNMQTATYEEVIKFYIGLAREFPEVNIQTIGETDSGQPLHMVTYNPDAEFNFQKIRQNKLVLLINNGIHPGEPDGIDATMMLYRDFALKRLPVPENMVLVSIPVYNIGGALNRNSHSRANQKGPEAYGFRGNARNYDLNRDFIKNDTKNAETFAGIFHMVKPDIFIDTHVSNGADYQYTLSHIFTQQDKLGAVLGTYLQTEFLPSLTDSLAAMDWEITPYVNVHGPPPDSGFSQFLDSPRYSTGYAALWGTLGVMLETHMLKPYADRVNGTYDFLRAIVQLAGANHEQIRLLRSENRAAYRDMQYYPLGWTIDSSAVRYLDFKGFEADTLKSSVTGLPRLKYNHDKPFTRSIPYWDSYRARDSVSIPEAYVIRKSWQDILEHLQRNDIAYSQFERDTTLLVEAYKINGYQTMASSYEGHYPHYGTSVTKRVDSLQVEAGDYFIPTDQQGIRYLLETLEPAAMDSFFNWNFFDAILQQKEGFSAYVFEDLAEDILQEDSVLRRTFVDKQQADPQFAADSFAQLDWIYSRSRYYESSHLQYPVYRIPGAKQTAEP